ncbi:hypothetical protein FD754_004560 [Muntiacus muntjak]|uniref:Uncharacterized protein n=1 Tax=Muntiacus muntjak TaxID=9888 RepID=A0A5N3WG08_MUNMU|nr:hypothetical protein FD754_004560 [Muntiacus muntjak]
MNCHMTQQSHCWANTLRKPELKETRCGCELHSRGVGFTESFAEETLQRCDADNSGEPGLNSPLQYYCLENSMDRGAWQTP